MKIALVALLGLLLAISGAASAYAGPQVVVYNNEACGHCQPYVNELTAGLKATGFGDIEVRQFINNESVRAELSSLQASRKVPLEMQGHLVASVEGGKYLFEGHVPVALVTDFLKNKAKDYPGGIVVTLDSMTSEGPYKVFDGRQVREFSPGQPIGSSGGLQAEGSGIGDYALPFLIIAAPLALLALAANGGKNE
jgi:hypothetical protein